MKRKVIKQANQAYTITLPVEWARKHNLDKNPEINLDINEKTLLISTSNPTAGGKVKINLPELNERNVSLVINALYARGIDEIEITSEGEIDSKISRALRDLNGYALVSKSDNKYVIKDIGGGNYENLDEIFKRVFQMVIIFYESSITDIFGKEEETSEGLNNRDLEVNKFCLFLERAINKMAYPDPINGRVLFTYAYALEQIGDEVHRLWRTNICHCPKKTKKLKEVMELSLECLEKSFDIYYQFSVKKLEEIYKIRDKAREIASTMEKFDYRTSRLLRGAIKISEDATDLTHLTLMRNLK